MDSQTKSAIKSLVLDLRYALEDELTLALKRYGISTDRAWPLDAPPDRLTEPAEREAWQRIVTVIRRGLNDGRTLPQASADYVREAAFTLLNRLVGLKCLEVRGIIPEIITTREIYSGRSLAHRDYRDAHPHEARASDDALPAAVAEACRRVNADLIGYLFDPDDDFSRLWPRYAVLKGCIEKINALDEAVWREDEIIGWLYQFYNAEEKVAVRRRGKPQTPHDVAVINQFFTPRWVVKFLVDNTLGRLWLEMHPDSVRVREKCDYLVPEVAGSKVASSTEQVASSRVASSKVASSRESDDAISDALLPATDALLPATDNLPATDALLPVTCYLLPDSPINNPAAPPRRAAKPVTEIRLLDPACGTMHFGHYACEVFDEMYRDSLDHGWPITSSKEQVASSKAGEDASSATCYLLPATDDSIPALILRHNLFGVDIDRRAVQLAALSLFMKARTMHPEAQVRQVNLVAADATLPDSGVREKFLARYKDAPPVQRAFAQVLEDMNHVAQVGSLLRVEERLRELLAEAGYALSETGALRRPRRQRTIPGLEAPVRQLEFGEQAEVGSGWTPGYTLAGLRDDLRAFARDALQEHDLNAQLFAAEADKAVYLLDVLMGEYDVVVMNPPYGEGLSQITKFLYKSYPYSRWNMYACFVERGLTLLSYDGYLGALTERLFLTQEVFEEYRTNLLINGGNLVTLLDLWYGVLDDAMNRTAAYVVSKRERQHKLSVFFDLKSSQNKQLSFELLLKQLPEEKNDIHITDIKQFLIMPRCALLYKFTDRVVRHFQELPTFGDVIGYATQGLITGNNQRFVRFTWEIPNYALASNWFVYAKGGNSSAYYKEDEYLVQYNELAKVSYNNQGRHRGQSNYFKEGISWADISGIFRAYYLPTQVINSQISFVLSLKDGLALWGSLAFLNSTFIFYLLSNIYDGHHWGTKNVRLLPWDPEILNQRIGLDDLAYQIYHVKSTWDTGNELCTRFTEPWLLQIYKSANQQITKSEQEAAGEPSGIAAVLALLGDAAPLLPTSCSLLPLLNTVRALEDAADARLQALQAEIDEAVYELYEITPADRALIERELGDRPPELVWPQLGGKADKEKRREHVRRLFSYYALRAARASDDGIVPLAGCAARAPTLIERVRALLEAEFGPEAAYQLEQDAAAYLERPLEAWLHQVFFRDFHVKLYKSRPILWHLASEKRAFAVLLDYHRLTRDTLPKVRSHYLWPQMEGVRTRLAAVKAHEGSLKEIADLEAELGDLEDCDRRLESVIQGAVEVEAPEWAVGPYRGGQAPYDPELDDGVAVNIAPVQAAGLLAGKVIK